jgi:hypothetical protein
MGIGCGLVSAGEKLSSLAKMTGQRKNLAPFTNVRDTTA